MILRPILIMPEILSSRKVAKLKPFAQLFYRNLMHACDGGGVFENDPKMLCTALYPRALDRVTPKAVATWLEECREAGLIRYFTDDKGRALGEFESWLQRDSKIKRRYSSREQPPGDLPGLFARGEPPPKRLNGIEGKSPQPPAEAGGRIASLPFRTEDRATSAFAGPTVDRPARRVRRLPKLADLREEKAKIDQEIQEIFRPGGCAYNVLPTGDKKVRADELIEQSKQLGQAMANVRAAHAKETAA